MNHPTMFYASVHFMCVCRPKYHLYVYTDHNICISTFLISRVISRAPGLKLVVETLITSLRPIGNIVLICCAFFIVFGILGVQVICIHALYTRELWRALKESYLSYLDQDPVRTLRTDDIRLSFSFPAKCFDLCRLNVSRIEQLRM